MIKTVPKCILQCVYVPVPGEAQVENAVKQTHESKQSTSG